ncbi:MAG: ribosome maturation factor RimM [Balneolaceae bacterium]
MIEGASILPFVQVGHIVRSQGLKGELKVLFKGVTIEALQQLSVLYLRNNRGDFYPCRIINLRVDGKGNKISFFVQFETIADRTSAEALRNKAVFVETEIAEQLFSEQPEEDNLIDYEVLNNQNKSIGLVIDFMDSGAQIVITVATTSGSLLIPMVDEFVTEIDHNTKMITCQNLDLLEDL